ncbi:KH domain-containing protein, partial [Candidatus Curtissbacteria bacterium]|nr:KH domain-containing protein [Candidatus Curtissbacteria bacterium]
MEDLLKLLIEPLVADFGKVKIEKNSSDDHFEFIIFIPKEDIAKVIGKE